MSQSLHISASPDAVAGRPPRLVLPFALYSALVLALVAGALLWFIRRDATDRAQRAVAVRASFVADTSLRGELTPEDFAHAARGARLRQLESLFAHDVLAHGGVRAKLYRPDGLVVFSTEPSLIGKPGDDPEEVASVAAGAPRDGMANLNHEGGSGPDITVVEALVPFRLAGGRVAGVLELYNDYRPVAAEIRSESVSAAIVLGAGLIGLYAALFPILLRASRRLRRQYALSEHQARHDALTGLPNRLALGEAGRLATAQARGAGSGMALFVMDLDRFKEINDTLGHHCGDVLLTQVADRLRAAVRGTDTVVRLGGDEFALVLPGVATEADAQAVARSVQRELERPFPVNGTLLSVGASIGVALFPRDGDTLDALLLHADVAMYAAKRTHAGMTLYRPDLATVNLASLTLAAELRGAISDGQVVTYFQPKCELATGRVVGAEALVRWRHPGRGTIEPGEFVPVAERTGLIGHLTLLVLESALHELHGWREDGADLSVSVNVSTQDLLDPALPANVERALLRAGVAAPLLEIEITEGSLITDPERAKLTLRQLRELGVSIAVDDYGVGHSSLTYLRDLPVDTLKIDRSFVTCMSDNDAGALIVRSTIELGHDLGMRVVAEGVETADVQAELTRLGCDLYQGFRLGSPMSPQEFRRWLHDTVHDPDRALPVPAATIPD